MTAALTLELSSCLSLFPCILMQNGSAHLQRPNRELTEEEKITKRNTKKLLKRQTRRRKLEVRLQQAIQRKDSALEDRSRRELEKFLQEENAVIDNASANTATTSSSKEKAARPMVESVYHRLQANLLSKNEKRELDMREYHTEQARELLQSMTKGTQKLDMFDNEAALLGYTRHKFIERAMLVVSSLAKLKDTCDQEKDDIYSRILERLLSVQTICSIGCGPGCDAVGIIAAFLSTLDPPKKLRRAVLLDWAMPQWESIVSPLKDLLVPNQIGRMDTGSCNVLKDISDAENASALYLMSTWGEEPLTDDQGCSVDFFVISYLLSETRGKWHAFFVSLVDYAAPRTIFLFTDPTAWQLHVLMERCKDSMDFVWLDSSMNRPELQSLENRVGPTVLLCIKRGDEKS